MQFTNASVCRALRSRIAILFGFSLLLTSAIGFLVGVASAPWLGKSLGPNVQTMHVKGFADEGGEQLHQAHTHLSFSGMLELTEQEWNRVDVFEVNLAIAREVNRIRTIDVDRYIAAIDEWAFKVKQEVDRHLYRFERAPSEFNNSKAYFCALVMRTVLDQDYGVRYNSESFSFANPEDLFVHGVIDKRNGTCISLPIVQIAIGQRLGWPIKAVAVPGHTFCRWDDPITGERLNIEAANIQGLVDRDDEYYRHWPYEIDPRWEKDHNVLKSLSMREHASIMVGALAGFFCCERGLAFSDAL